MLIKPNCHGRSAFLHWKAPASRDILFHLVAKSIQFWYNWIVTNAGAIWWWTTSKGTCIQEYSVRLLVNNTWFWVTDFSVMLVPFDVQRYLRPRIFCLSASKKHMFLSYWILHDAGASGYGNSVNPGFILDKVSGIGGSNHFIQTWWLDPFRPLFLAHWTNMH
jgi:hypothetical protein